MTARPPASSGKKLSQERKSTPTTGAALSVQTPPAKPAKKAVSTPSASAGKPTVEHKSETKSSGSAPVAVDPAVLAETLQKFVAVALTNRIKSSRDAAYDQMIADMSKEGNHRDPAALARWYNAVSKNVSLLRTEHQSLVTLIYKFTWQMPLPTVEAYCTLTLNLVTGNNVFLVPSMKMLAGSFLHENVTGVTHVGNHEVASMDQIHAVVHRTLQRIVELAPASTQHLFTAVVELFPHWRQDVVNQQVYMKNMLHAAEYAGTLRDRILTAIIERLIQIDVEIVIEHDDGEKSDADEEDDDLIFSLDADDHKGGKGAGARKVDPNVDKLDELMGLMFEYLALIRKGKASMCDEVFESLIRAFERTVLRTHKSRFTQFLVFYYCSIKHVYAEAFIRRLAEKLLDHNTNTVERHNAAAFIASFIARAAFLRHATAVSWFEVLLEWLHHYIDAQKKSAGGAAVSIGPQDATVHSVFYAVCQAIFYIFCFRQASFAEQLKAAPQQLQAKWKLKQLVTSAFNPLRYCSENVVQEFARVTRNLKLVDCEPVLQANLKLTSVKAVSAESKLSLSGDGGPSDRYFPFDPYLLKRSSKYLENLYIGWDEDDDDEIDEPDSPTSPVMTPLHKARVKSKSIAMGSVDSGMDSGLEDGLSAMSVSATNSPVPQLFAGSGGSPSPLAAGGDDDEPVSAGASSSGSRQQQNNSSGKQLNGFQLGGGFQSVAMGSGGSSGTRGSSSRAAPVSAFGVLTGGGGGAGAAGAGQQQHGQFGLFAHAASRGGGGAGAGRGNGAVPRAGTLRRSTSEDSDDVDLSTSP